MKMIPESEQDRTKMKRMGLDPNAGPGKHKGTPDSEFDPEQLALGIRIELEHTGNRYTAKQIAKDHLKEDPDYYRKLVRMEAKKGWGVSLEVWLKAQQLGLFAPIASTHQPARGGHGTGQERPGHKYTKREGSPGNYKYTYPDDEPKPAKPAAPEPAPEAKPTTPEQDKANRYADSIQKVLDLLARTKPEVQDRVKQVKADLVRGIGFLRSGAYAQGKKDYEGKSLDDRFKLLVAQSQKILPELDKPAAEPKPEPKPTPKEPEPPKPEPKPEPPKPAEPAKPKRVVIRDERDKPAEAPAEKPKPAPAVEAPKPKPVPEKPKRDPVPPVEKPKPAMTIPARIERSGDHIWGARRDLVDKVIQSSKDLDDISFDDAALLVTKDKLLPKLDMETLRAQGVSPGAAHMCLAMLAAIQNKPKKNRVVQAEYVDRAQEIVKSLSRCKNLSDWARFQQELQRAQTQGMGAKVVSTVGTKEEAIAEAERLRKEDPSKEYQAGFSYNDYKHKVFYRDPGPYAALGKRFLDFIGNRSNDFKDAYVEAMTADNMWSRLEGGKGFDNAPPVEDGWKYLEERGAISQKAQLKKKAQSEEMKKKLAERGLTGTKAVLRIVRETQAEVTRNGGQPVPDANPDRVRETFKLREVDFGQDNYMSQGDRAYHVKALEGALHDLSEVLGVPPSAVSFNGRLGVAMGARGRGDASAHYEPGRYVMNLTKYRGGGSLAHEWGHAMDNILTLPHDLKSLGGGASFVTDHAGRNSLPQNLSDALQKVSDAMLKHPDPEKAKAKHRATKLRLEVEANTLISQSNRKVRELNQLGNKVPPADVPARLERTQKRLEETAKALADEKAPSQPRREYLEGTIASLTKYMEDLKSGSVVQQPADVTRAEELKVEVEAFRQKINAAKSTLAAFRKTSPLDSDFATDATMLGPYYRNTQELFARAFESYIQDELAAKGRKSTYLVAGTASKYAAMPRGDLPSKYSSEPYPQGEERKAINAAMRELLQVVREHGLLQKAAAYIPEPPRSRQASGLLGWLGGQIVPVEGVLEKGHAEARPSVQTQADCQFFYKAPTEVQGDPAEQPLARGQDPRFVLPIG